MQSRNRDDCSATPYALQTVHIVTVSNHLPTSHIIDLHTDYSVANSGYQTITHQALNSRTVLSFVDSTIDLWSGLDE